MTLFSYLYILSYSSSNTCQTGLYALHWSCILLTHGWKQNDVVLLEHIPQIVEIQSILYSNVEAGNNAKRSTKAFNLVREFKSTFFNWSFITYFILVKLCVRKNTRLWKTVFRNHEKLRAVSFYRSFLGCYC